MKRYERQGLLALDPQAFFGFFPEDSTEGNRTINTIATVVSIRGPLEHHAGWWGDSYDAIRDRVAEACAGPAEAVVLRIDSPGGDVSGCFDTAKALRAMCAAAGKRLFAYVDGSACSAAYALATAAERIVASPTGSAGSVGVIATRVDATGADEKWGVKFAFIASGARKTHGNPHVAMDETEAAETRRMVDWLASSFFDLVAEMRGLDPKAVADLEAGVFRGPEAVSTGLVDELGTFEDLLASIANPDNRPEGRASEESMDEEEKKAREALQSIVDDDKADAKAKARAKKALAAMDDEDDTKDDDESAEDESDEEKKDETKDEEAAAQPDAIRALVRSELQAVAAKAAEDAERTRLLASRPDLDEPTRALLAAAPLAQVKSYVETAPRRALKPAASAIVGSTRAEGQGEREMSDSKRTLDQLMGLAEEERAPRFEGKRHVFPVMNRAQRAKYLEARAKKTQPTA